jgi:hypothetical protein
MLIHEVMHVVGIDAIVARLPNTATVREHLIAIHLVPGDNTKITDEMCTDEPRRDFNGDVALGEDPMRV